MASDEARGGAATKPRLALERISKRFGSKLANDRLSLAVQPGEIHALLGENGAGKSTLMKVLYGVHAPDCGRILWNGREVNIPDPGAARKLGIGMVFQHFCLVERLNVLDNLRLALPELADVEIRQRFDALGERLQPRVGLAARVSDLSAGERQHVEILRCLMADVALLILDEPTSVLTPQEANALMGALRRLAADGCSILFITHKLVEVELLCDRATVLRAGQLVGTVPLAETSRAELVSMMLGKSLTAPHARPPAKPGRTLLSARLENCGRLKQARFSLRAGEITGIGGVAGSGQQELLELISGERPLATGCLRFVGQDISGASVRRRRALGIRSLPVDRLGRGAVASLSLAENFLLTHNGPGALADRPWINWAGVGDRAEQALAEHDIRAVSATTPAGELSGGNLQRFLVARELWGQPRLLACHNPTWGVDPAATARIHQRLLDACAAGAAVLVLSEDINELFSLCDRLGALCNGRLSPVRRKAAVTAELMGRWMTEHGSG